MEHGNVVQLYSPQGRRINTGDTTCHLYKTYFAGQYTMKYSRLEEILQGLVGNDTIADDFVSLLILYVFSMLLFPLPNGGVNLKMLSFAQDLEKMSSYSWATAVCQSILFTLAEAHLKGSVNIDVCSFVVNVWFMERCTSFAGRVMMGGVSRYYNWSMRQRMKDAAVNKMFQNLSASLICKQKKLPFVHDNEPMIVKAGCTLGLLNKFVGQLQLEDEKRKRPGLVRTAVRKRYSGRLRAQEAEEEEEGEEIEVVEVEEEEEEQGEGDGHEVEVEEESGGGEQDEEKDEEAEVEEVEKEVEAQVQVEEAGAQEKEAEATEQTQSENIQEEHGGEGVDWDLLDVGEA